mgnify:CR=1 FL=1
MLFPVPLFYQFAILSDAGWINRRQQHVIEYLKTENQVLREQRRGGRVRFTDKQRRKLAEKAKRLNRSTLLNLNPIGTPDTLLRWYRRLIAAKYDSSAKRPMARPQVGRPPIDDELRQLVVQLAEANRI